MSDGCALICPPRNTLDFTESWHSRSWSLSRILKDEEALKGYGGAFSDGMGGVCWFSGSRGRGNGDVHTLTGTYGTPQKAAVGS